MPMFSVIIPSYGRPQYLQEAVRSVLGQTVDDLEVIVVDDASPTPITVDAAGPIRVIRAEVNGGAAAARNLGASVATGDVLTFLDDDDVWMPERLELARLALERADVGICWQSPKGGRVLEGSVHGSVLDSVTPHLGATAIARRAWVPMDHTYRACEDLLWWLDVTKRSSVATIARQGLRVRRHDGPRVGYGTEARIASSLRLLEERRSYFLAHPRARAYRWMRIGAMQMSLDGTREARRSLVRSLRVRPSAAACRQLGRALLS